MFVSIVYSGPSHTILIDVRTRIGACKAFHCCINVDFQLETNQTNYNCHLNLLRHDNIEAENFCLKHQPWPDYNW